MKRHEKVLENFSIGLLIFAGLLGMFVVLLDFVGEDFVAGPWRWLKGPETIILLIVASLALALGLERFVRFQQINRQLSGLERALEQAIGGRLIEDFEDLYDTAARMVLDARDHIRVSSLNLGQPRTYVLTGRADASKRYDEALVDSLQRSLRRPRPIKTDIILGTDFDKAVDTVHERAEKRLGGGLRKLV